jgi:hypothetical protein
MTSSIFQKKNHILSIVGTRTFQEPPPTLFLSPWQVTEGMGTMKVWTLHV